MITFRNLGYQGRLGNQLFQIASTIGIARATGEQPIFRDDWLYREYFSLPNEMYAPKSVTDTLPDSSDVSSLLGHIDPRARPYLQDVGLFLRDIDEVREYLRPSETAQQQLTPNVCSHAHIGLHVRRGDNIYDPGVPNKIGDYYLIPTVNYFMNGLGVFSYEDGSYPPLWIFSDDIPWCKESLPPAERYGNNTPYVKEHEPEYGTFDPIDWVDLFHMSQADGFVLSNSTFSIWAALLSKWGISMPTSVVRPDKVYGPMLGYIDDNLMFHPDWKVLPCS